MNNKLIIELDELLPLGNVWQRWHWSKRRNYMKTLSWIIFSKLPKLRDKTVIPKCKIKVTRFSSQEPDTDGLYTSLKPLLDCLVVNTKKNPYGLNIIKDDKPSVIIQLDAYHQYIKPKSGKTVCEIIY